MKMPSRFHHRALIVMAVSACASALPACAFASVHASASARASASASGASPYPAGATRPLLIAKRSEFAHAGTTAPAGGSSAPTSGPAATPAPAKVSPSRTCTVPKAHASKPAMAKCKPKPKPVLHGDPARALVAFEAMQKNYYIPGSGLYQGEPFSFLWPFSQALAATVTLSNMTGISAIPGLKPMLQRELNARLTGLKTYLDTNNSGQPEGTFTSTLAAYDGTVAPPAGPGGAKYYDDNEWIGIELMRVYEQIHYSALLGSAEGIMAFVMAGWSTNPAWACPGGEPFSNLPENGERNAVTDGPGAELAVQLYKATGNVGYLQFAEKAYEWVRHCLYEANGLYADHIGDHGVVNPNYWSYNQGAMIGAGVLLYQATNNSAYLWEARQTAKAALAYYTAQRLGEENPFFVSVYFRNMLYLDSVTHDPPGYKLAQPYVDYAWEHLRLANNLFVFGSPPTGQLLYQAAIAQIYGLLSSPPATYF
jgi:hypothetical protein